MIAATSSGKPAFSLFRIIDRSLKTEKRKKTAKDEYF